VTEVEDDEEVGAMKRSSWTRSTFATRIASIVYWSGMGVLQLQCTLDVLVELILVLIVLS
jgi:hypothetical protein